MTYLIPLFRLNLGCCSRFFELRRCRDDDRSTDDNEQESNGASYPYLFKNIS